MGSKSYTTVTDDRDVVSGADQAIGVIGAHNVVNDPKVALAAIAAAQTTATEAFASTYGVARDADIQLTESFLAAFGQARAGEQALFDSALGEAARAREADQALLAAALTPDQAGGATLLTTITMVAALAAGAVVLTRWGGR